MQNYLEFFAREMRTRRKREGLSQEDLAGRTDVSLALVSELERGIANPTLQTLNKISTYFQASLPEMLTTENHSESIAAAKLRCIAAILEMKGEKIEKIAKFIDKIK
ncbi:MAG: helix-turn-helix domain-containing protein [Desulfovibrio sp.]|nr:helix-turn-helix domain-containing protein [Desulfovibrio sp.]